MPATVRTAMGTVIVEAYEGVEDEIAPGDF
jgi:hypothetical protein